MMTDRDPGGAAGRKDDHVLLALRQRGEGGGPAEFDDVEFVHHALDGIDADRVDLRVHVGDRVWPVPLYINAMTGGTAEALRINRDLAIAAREVGLPIATGSVSVALDDARARESFRVVRAENPAGVVFANVGADRSPDDARRAVDLLRADALQVHLNAVQETVMPEGARGFSGWAASLDRIRAAVDVPVIVKEVGSGLSRRTLARLHAMGIPIADVGGVGGTDFGRIENARRPAADHAELIGWGQSAVCCLLDAPSPSPVLLASGGVRGPLDVVRALALGARAVGASGRFLEIAVHGGAEGLVAELQGWRRRIAEIMALLGAATPADLVRTDVLLRGRVHEFCTLRGIDAGALTRRSDTQGETDVR